MTWRSSCRGPPARPSPTSRAALDYSQRRQAANTGLTARSCATTGSSGASATTRSVWQHRSDQARLLARRVRAGPGNDDRSPRRALVDHAIRRLGPQPGRDRGRGRQQPAAGAVRRRSARLDSCSSAARVSSSGARPSTRSGRGRCDRCLGVRLVRSPDSAGARAGPVGPGAIRRALARQDVVMCAVNSSSERIFSERRRVESAVVVRVDSCVEAGRSGAGPLRLRGADLVKCAGPRMSSFESAGSAGARQAVDIHDVPRSTALVEPVKSRRAPTRYLPEWRTNSQED